MGAKKIDWELLLIHVLAAEAVGCVSMFLSGVGQYRYSVMICPPGILPDNVFSAVWVVLYFLMGAASYIITEPGKNKNELYLYRSCLLVNFLWPIFFFGLNFRLFAFLWILLQIYLAYRTHMAFRMLNKMAGKLLLPYLLWLLYMAYGNIGLWILNK